MRRSMLLLPALAGALGFRPQSWSEGETAGPTPLVDAHETHRIRVVATVSAWDAVDHVAVTVTAEARAADGSPLEVTLTADAAETDHLHVRLDPCRTGAGACEYAIDLAIDAPEPAQGEWSVSASVEGYTGCGQPPRPEEVSVAVGIDE